MKIQDVKSKVKDAATGVAIVVSAAASSIFSAGCTHDDSILSDNSLPAVPESDPGEVGNSSRITTKKDSIDKDSSDSIATMDKPIFSEAVKYNLPDMDLTTAYMTEVALPFLTGDAEKAVSNVFKHLNDEQKLIVANAVFDSQEREQKHDTATKSYPTVSNTNTLITTTKNPEVSRKDKVETEKGKTINLNDLRKSNPVPAYQRLNETLISMIELGSVMYGLEGISLEQGFVKNVDGSYEIKFNDPLKRIPSVVVIPELTPVILNTPNDMHEKMLLACALQMAFYHGSDTYENRQDRVNNNSSFVRKGENDLQYVKTRVDYISRVLASARTSKNADKAMKNILNNENPLFKARENEDKLTDANKRMGLLFDAIKNRTVPTSRVSDEAIETIANLLYMPNKDSSEYYGFPDNVNYAYSAIFSANEKVIANRDNITRICRQIGVEFPDINIALDPSFSKPPTFFVTSGNASYVFEGPEVIGSVKSRIENMYQGSLIIREKGGFITSLKDLEEKGIPYFDLDNSKDFLSAANAIAYSALGFLDGARLSDLELSEQSLQVLSSAETVARFKNMIIVKKRPADEYRSKFNLGKVKENGVANLERGLEKARDKVLMSPESYKKIEAFSKNLDKESYLRLQKQYQEIANDFKKADTTEKRDKIRERVKIVFGHIISPKITSN